MPAIMVVFGAWGMMILCMALWGISDGFTTWRLPFWKMDFGPGLFVLVFLMLWFGVIFHVVWYALLPLHRVKITSDEVRICLGPVTLHRLSLMDVKTVVQTGENKRFLQPLPLAYFRSRPVYGGRKASRLVLMTVSSEELRERARDRKTVEMSTVPDRRVREYTAKAFFHNRFWLEWSAEAEKELRKYLPFSGFIL